MCGISGFIDKRIGREQGENILNKMLEATKHRGPDNSSVWQNQSVFLGHNRLSILDLRDEANQPMHSEGFTIIYNGEVYNYLEIKAELNTLGYQFKTTCDTEVILMSYKAWGPSCVSRFVGMWSFAIWDHQQELLFCSRDRFGIKPFYYFAKNDSFYFASEVKALKMSPHFDTELNLDQVSLYLQLGWYFNKEQTLYKGVLALPGGHNLIYQHGKIEINKYWELDNFAPQQLSQSEKNEHFKSLFYDSIKLHIRSDVEVGTCLSGGLDSSSIASVYSNIYCENKLKAFNIYYDGEGEVDERPWVHILKDKYPNLDTHYYSPGDNELSEHFDNFIHHMEFPCNGSSPFSQYFVMKLVNSQGIKVVLDGQGADEYLAGYMHGTYRHLADSLIKFKLGDFWRQMKGHSDQQNHSIHKMSNVLLKTILASFLSEDSLYRLEYQKYFPFVSQMKRTPPFAMQSANTGRLNQFLQHQVTQSSLPNLLHNEDSNSMAFSIESRVPFLDHRLVEFCFTLQNEDKINRGVSKNILRNALQNELPRTIAQRKDKKGFVTPGEVKWLKGPLKFLLEMDYKKMDFLQTGKVASIIDNYKKGDLKNANMVWRLAVLNYWLAKHH